MGQPAARLGDNVLQTPPHCHAPIHPAAPVPTAVPHPGLPLAIITGAATVLIGGAPAARATNQTALCMLPGYVPNGPGIIAKGSATVLIENLTATRVGDMSSHPGCVAPIPSPVGNILPPGCPIVLIGRYNALRLGHFEALKPVCPRCRTERQMIAPLTLATILKQEDDHIIEGVLHCTNSACQLEYPIIDGIPIIIPYISKYLSDNLFHIYDVV